MLRVAPELVRQHNAEHIHKPFYPGLEAFITAGPVVAMVCQVSKFQWIVATDEPSGAIWQDLTHEGVQNVFVFSALVGMDWKFQCHPQCTDDEWEFDGLGAFLQRHVG